MRIAVVNCHKQPDYIRARVLRTALAGLPGVEVVRVSNKSKSLWRFLEIAARLVWASARKKPDIYLVTFRGYEILPLALLLAGKRPVVFDEFINPIEWLDGEHGKLPSPAVKFIKAYYGFLLARVRLILADTEPHADYSAELMGLARSKYVVVPVSTDEAVFRPRPARFFPHSFKVFYYGSMLPLHGLEYVVQAAEGLKNNKDIQFLIVGGGAKTKKVIKNAAQSGANIEYRSWVPFAELPALALSASLCLAGPFGDTLQASMVITGKTYQFLAARLPTLVGKTKATGHFHDGVNCLMVPPGSSEVLARKILWAYENKPKLEAIGREGRLTYQKYYSNKIVADKLQRIIKTPDVAAPEPTYLLAGG